MSAVTKKWETIGTVAEIPDPATARARARDILIFKRDGLSSATLSPPGKLTDSPTTEDTALVKLTSDATEVCLVEVQGLLRDTHPATGRNSFALRFLEYLTHCETRKQKKRRGPNKPKTILEKKLVINKHVLPKWRDRDIKTITRREAENMIDSVAHLPGAQYRVYSMLHHFFTWAVHEEYIAAHPMSGMGAPYEYIPRDRVLSRDEIRWLWMACDCVGYPLGPWTKMLLLTVQRCNEVMKMSRWDIDQDRVWKLGARMTKSRRPHVVFLSDFATEVLSGVPQFADTGLIFMGRSDKGCHNTTSQKKLHSLMVEFKRRELSANGQTDVRHVTIDPWVFHDLRRTGATIMAKRGHPKDIVHKILNHSDGGGQARGVGMLDQVYIIHEYEEEREKALQDLGNYVKQIVNIRPKAR